MSLPLIDVRCKLPVDLDAVLEAIAEAQGREKGAVVREFVEKALTRELHIPRLIHSKLEEVGMVGLLRESEPVVGKK